MRCKLILVALLFALPAFAQEVRVDQSLLTPGPNVPGFGFPRPQALIQANATVNLCAHPSSINSCTPITTYSDSTGGTTCPPYAQLTILPGSVCTASVGTSAKMGFWYAGGTVDYYVTENGQTLGPYSVTYATSSFNGGSVANAITAPGFTGPLTGGVTGHASLDLPLTGGSVSGLISFSTDIMPHPPLNVRSYGAVGDCTTDDFAAIQSAITASCSSASHPPVYFPKTACGGYLVKDSLNITYGNNFCANVILYGDLAGAGNGKQVSIIGNFPSGKPYAVLDFLGCNACGFTNINIGIPNGSFAAAGFLNGLYGSTADGSNFRVEHSSVGVSFPGPSGVPAGIVYHTDENQFNDFIASGSSPVVVGNTLGRNTSITSEYGTIGSTIDSMTQFTCHNCQFSGTSGLPTFQITSGAEYSFTGKTYFNIDNATTNSGGILEITQTLASGGAIINCDDCRTENQNANLNGVCAINLDGTLFPSIGGGHFTGALNAFPFSGGTTSNYGFCSSSTSDIISNLHFIGVAPPTLFNYSGTLASSSFFVSGSGTSAVGTARVVFNTVISPGNAQTFAQIMAGISSHAGSIVCAQNFQCSMTDLTVGMPYIGFNGITTNSVSFGNSAGGQTFPNNLSTIASNFTYTIPAANSVWVVPLSSAPSGGCVGWIDSSGVQHGCTVTSASHGELSFETGPLTSVSTSLQYGAGEWLGSTISSFTWTATANGVFTCSGNPTITLYSCGTGGFPGGTCAAPVAIGSATLTAVNVPVNVTASSSSLVTNAYYMAQFTAGTCTALNVTAKASY